MMKSATGIALLHNKFELFDECYLTIFSIIQNFCKQCQFAKERYYRPVIMNE